MKKITNLTQALEWMKSGEEAAWKAAENGEFAFGGEEPADTTEVWGWDEAHLLVGTHAGALEIISRDEME